MKLRKCFAGVLLLFLSLSTLPLPVNATLSKEDIEKISQIYSHTKTPSEWVDIVLEYFEEGYYRHERAEEYEKQLKIVEEKKDRLKTIEESIELLKPLLLISGGKHSMFMTTTLKHQVNNGAKYPALMVGDRSDRFENMPYYTFSNHLLTIVMPGYLDKTWTFKRISEYTDIFHKAFQQKDIKGILLDLRENFGGEFRTMLISVLPLLPEGVAMSNINPKGEESSEFIVESLKKGISLEGKTYYVDHEKIIDVPIAILTSNFTASSGEAVLMSLMGLDNVKSFGQETAGFNSYNTVYQYGGKYILLLTTHMMQARDGSIFYEEPIQPDVVTDQPMEEALKWLESEMNK